MYSKSPVGACGGVKTMLQQPGVKNRSNVKSKNVFRTQNATARMRSVACY